MPVEAQFQPGSKHLIIALLNAIKDFLPTNAANFIFSPRGISLRFASGRNTESRAVVACHIDADPFHRPFAFARNVKGAAGRRRSSASSIAPSEHSEEATAAGGTPGRDSQSGGFLPPPPPVAGSGYGALAKYVCTREAVFVGFNPRLMMDQLRLVDEDDKITLRAEENEEGTVLLYEMYIESQDFTRKILYEVDAIPLIDRFVPLPDINYNVICQIQSGEFQRVITALHDTSDKISIVANKNSITFLSSGADGTLQVGLVQKPSAASEKHPRFKVLSYIAPTKHVVDARILRGFVLATPLSQHVILHLPAPPGTPSDSTPPPSLSSGHSRSAAIPSPIRITYEIEVVNMAAAGGVGIQLASSYRSPTGVSISSPVGAQQSQQVQLSPKAAAETPDSESAPSSMKPIGPPPGLSLPPKVVGQLHYFLMPELGSA
ncbi:hypothetical protein BJ742DRAFT_842167 [Cladochytrium replicatum]|nr:hypothetical protein BJ742DRAFT_842167 [Cladochytrium replicatum]